MNEPGAVASPQTPLAETSLDIAAAPDLVWQALTTDGGLEPWMGDGASIDPTPGGRMILPDVVGGRPRAGRVERIQDQHSLEFAWWPITRPADRSNVSITITPIEIGTRVTVTERPPVTASATSSTTSSTTAAAAAPSVRAATAGFQTARVATGSLKGFWAWRLAVLSLTCQAARV